MVTWWLPVNLLNISANINHLETWLTSIKRSFWGLFVAFETVRIIKELIEIWLNEVCDKNTWKNRKNLENTKELVDEFERAYEEEAKELRQQEQKEEKKEFSQELPREFMAKILYKWGQKRYEKEKKKN